MNRLISICYWVIIIMLSETLHAQEANDGGLDLSEFEDQQVAEKPIKESIVEAVLNGTEKDFAKEFISKAITDRYKFLDVSYVNPSDDTQKDGWNVKYNWQYRNSSDGGFSIDSGTAILKQIAFEIDISGTAGFGSADNVEDYSSAKLAYNYLYGNFGKLRVIDKGRTVDFEKCLQNALSQPTDAELLAAEAHCWVTHRIDELVNDPRQSYVLSASVTAGLEGDQGYHNKQSTYGFRGVFSRDMFPSVRLDYEKIDASNDDIRMALTNDQNYDRLSGELGYRYPLFKSDGYNTWFYISYRYFKELSAPDSIKAANLDEFDFVSASIRFPARLLGFIEKNDHNFFYFRYTDGQLPFDRQSDKSLQLGFSTNMSTLGKLLSE